MADGMTKISKTFKLCKVHVKQNFQKVIEKVFADICKKTRQDKAKQNHELYKVLCFSLEKNSAYFTFVST